MAKSTQSPRPRKPRADFPLFPHRSNRWAKKIKGKFVYFGKVSDDLTGERALEKWLADKDALLAGKEPRKDVGGLTVAELVNAFLTDRKNRMDAGELAPRTFSEYHKACARVVDTFGRTASVVSLTTDDFASLRSSLAKTRGPVALGNEVQRVRTLFKFGYDNAMLEHPIRFGTSFDKPPVKAVRKARAAAGPRMFHPDELRQLINAAETPLRAFILLGVNCALGASDIAQIPKASIDLQGGWLTFARIKTGVPRRCKLWPETVTAIKEALAVRPEPLDRADAGLCFISRKGGRWVQPSKSDDVAKWASRRDLISYAFQRMTVRENVAMGKGFYSLRRTFQTAAEESGDFPATSFVMGHAPQSGDMAAVYRQRIADSRLEAVAAVVHAWLFATAAKSSAN